MPFAKFDVELLTDERIAAIPEKHRAAAIALWWSAILYSAERLKDGHVTRTVLGDLARETGQLRPKNVILTLTNVKLLETTTSGFRIVDWESFHSSRAEVERQRSLDAERKRRSRGGQIQLDVQSGHPNGVTAGQERDSRGRARASTATETTTTPEPAAGTKDLEDSEPLESAAAEPSKVEAPRPTRIAEVLAEFAPGDPDSINHVEPLAVQLDAATFEAIVAKTKSRKQVRNKAGFLVDSLRNEITARQRQHIGIVVDPTAVVTSPIERIKREEPERYIESMAGALDEKSLEHYLTVYVKDEDQRHALRDRWHDARATAA